ncbi:MAG: bile acid:sodium symporter [Actinomycetota bacterium]|jgi:ACR3 family arsenite efflux pump ArsB|nr:bile acid:sodium symporter [Actinomycetota bacterium]
MAGRRLSVRDEVKPFVLIAAVVLGIAGNRLAAGRFAHLSWVSDIAIFAVMFAVMAFVEVKDVAVAFHKVKPTALALVTNFVFTPAFAWALGWLILRHYPDLWAGVILYTLTPCIGWYLIFTDLAQGDVAWGVSLLPWNLTLQILLLPFYLWLLVGKVVPISAATLFGSVGLYLVAPFALAYAVRVALGRLKGQAWVEGAYKHALGEVKMWALAVLIVAIFTLQTSFGGLGLTRIALIIAATVAFFAGLFVLSLNVGRRFRLGYADTATLVFTTTARNSESVIGVAAVAFAGHPLVLVAILVGPVVELPALLGLSRLMVALRSRLVWPGVPPSDGAAAALPDKPAAARHEGQNR